VSGGKWGYQSYRIEEQAEALSGFVKAIAQSEHIIDWAESGDTVRRREDGSGAERDLYDLWLATFNMIYGDD
jgi:hypothetical protein